MKISIYIKCFSSLPLFYCCKGNQASANIRLSLCYLYVNTSVFRFMFIIQLLYFLYEKQDRDYLCVWKRVSIPLYILFPLQYCMTVQFRLLSEQ